MRLNITVLFLLTLLSTQAQTGGYAGRVLDAATLEPLPFANVFINNTTIGTTTNVNGEFLLRHIPIGNSEIIFSFVGYQTYQTRIAIQEGSTKANEVIKLIPIGKQLSEVQVVSSRDKVWEKQLRRFEKIFLGDGTTASECKILNPWAIEFSEENKTLMAQSSVPIEIRNENLGYQILFYLKDFKYNGTSYSIVGNTRFQEMTTGDARQALRWMKNRETAYRGSLKHFLKSILDKNISLQGFKVFLEKNPQHSFSFSTDLSRSIIVPYDTLALVAQTGLQNELKIPVKGKIEIHYIDALAKILFYKDISNSVSWLEVKNGYLRVNKEGVLLNPTEVTVSGDMSAARVASMLPLDYVPGKIIAIHSNESFSARRLQEKVYVRTDKPYYYAGENVWLSAFMNYRAPGAADTLSKVLYVDLLDQDLAIAQSLILKIDSGRAMGNFKIPSSIKSGNYYLRAYTSWMRNYGTDDFFYKQVPVLDLHDKVLPTETPDLDSGSLQITLDKRDYHKREKVQVKLDLRNEDDSLIRANVSVSVVDLSQVILVKEEPKITEYYPIAEELPKNMLNRFSYPIERGIRMSGIYFGKKNKPEKTKLTVVKENWEDIYQVYSDDKGFFSIPDLIFYDSMRFGFQSDGGKVILKEKDNPISSFQLPEYSIQIIKGAESVQPAMAYEPDKGVIMLKEIEVKSEKIVEGKGYDGLYGKPDSYLSGESLERLNPNLATAIETKLPGYRLTYSDMHWWLTWTRSNFTAINTPAEPALFIDNIPFVNMGETVGDRLYALNTSMIDHIEVSSMINSQMGANNSYGVIFVFTKKAIPDKFKSIPTVKLRGFDAPHFFQGPAYETSQPENSKPDYRSTIYWNPKINLNYSKTRAEFSFYTSDISGNYRIIVEGVTEKGTTVRAEKIVKVVD
jgi:hypothetical protein